MPDRSRLRATFDSAADLYHRARPRYPAELFETLEAAAGLSAPARVLEIGPATGVATIPLAERGHRVTAIELGPELAAHARANTAHLPDVEIIDGSFDDWEPPAWGSFDLVAVATAWHWLRPETKYRLAHRHLAPGGALAFWSATHVVPDGGDRLFADIQPIYDEIGESLPGDDVFPRPGELPDQAAEIEATGLFAPALVAHFDWEIAYDADGYIDLLNTFSGHIAMADRQRDRLYGEIRRRLAARTDGLVRRHWGAVLHVAHSIDAPITRSGEHRTLRP